MYRVAIVDDNEAWCFVLKTVLHQQGFAVSTFTDAHTFLDVADQFDIALIDFSMPTRPFQKEIDGSRVIAELKARLDNPPLLILTSAYFTEQVLPVAHEICPEADACLSKNTRLEKIVETVKRCVTSGAWGIPFWILDFGF